MMDEATDLAPPRHRAELPVDYQPPAGAYDEMVTLEGTLRPAWQKFVGKRARLDTAGLGQLSDQARRVLREDGVTYSTAGAPLGPARPWELDPVPLLFDKRSWQTLADALAQRVALLNLILADVYGPRRLLSEGVLPPAVAFGHPGFLLPCAGIPVPDGTYLHLYAGHLARQPDGQWLVLADRTQGPSGAGYAVENRLVVSRMLPQEFQSLRIERLAPFFIALRDRLLACARQNRDNPRTVLLSPGSHSNMYFEDAYLARYLGYMLAEDGDLTVRGDVVYLKTLGGLLPVDVILRRVFDFDCDPLELRPDSSSGTAGLVQALRSGKVVFANALGTGFLEAPALAAFLPAACRFLLNEDLRMASVPTWWCGRNDDFEYVERHLEELIVRHAFVHRAAPAIVAASLTSDQRRQLMAQIRRRPEDFVAQWPVQRSTAPVWDGRALQPWRVGLRAFAVSGPKGYQVMSGGLARMFDEPLTFDDSITAGKASKDVWILGDAPVKPVTLLEQPRKAVELRRSTADLPSRVADDLFWMGRHAERAEAMVRHLRSCAARLTSDFDPAGLAEVAVLVGAISDAGFDASAFATGSDAEAHAALSREILPWLFDAQRAGALAHTLSALFRTGARVRDRLSVDGWRILNELNLSVLFPWQPHTKHLGDFVLLLNQALNLLNALAGLNTESMTRGPGWRFLDMGRRIERALVTLALVRRTLVDSRAARVPVLEAVLEICDSAMTYRYRYLTTLQLAPVLDLVLVDATNPRAVGYQLDALSAHVAHLPTALEGPQRNPERTVMLAAQSTLRFTDVEALCETDRQGQCFRLDDLLTKLEGQLRELSDDIRSRYLTHTVQARQLGMQGGRRRQTRP